MKVSAPPEGILDPQQPYWPADKVSDRIWLRLKGKLTGRKVEGLSENFTSYVNLGNADADRLIENIKKYGKYPQVNQNDKYGGAYNNEEYQKWLVEEFLEKPFREQTNKKIEDAAIESRIKEIQEERKEKAKSFISGATAFRPGTSITSKSFKTSGIIPKTFLPKDVLETIIKSTGNPNVDVGSEFRPGKSITAKTFKPSGVIPKKSIPKEVEELISKKLITKEIVEKLFTTQITNKETLQSSTAPKVTNKETEKLISKQPESSEETVGTSKRVVHSLGRLTLDLEIINNNLDRIKEIIVDDYKETKETNKKEIEEYRRRIANRGRLFGKKELGDKKTDILGGVKKYVGSFFSGAGGAIRALAGFNLLQAILDRDPGKIIQSLLGIGLTYLPAIGGIIAGAVVKSLMGKIFGAGARAAAPGMVGRGARITGDVAKTPRMGKIGKYAGIATLLGSGLALGTSLLNRPEEEDTQQQKLEELTQQQKGMTTPSSLVPLPQNELKRFDNLNKKFEEALDFLLKKQKEGRTTQQKSGGAPPPPPLPPRPGDFKGSSGSQKTMSYLMSQGLTKEQSAGIAGNLMQESQFNPMADNNPGSATEGHFGIAQWDKKIRWPRVKTYIESIGMDPYSLEGQLVGLRWESGQRGDWEKVKTELTSDAAARSWLKNFERSGEKPGMSGYEARISNARSLAAAELPTASTVPSPITAAPTSSPRQMRNIPAPSAQSPNITLVPMSVGGQTSQSSNAAIGNDVVPAIDTTYPENFLALYSKLIYQIV